MTYREFLSNHESEIDILSVFDSNGEEIEDTKNIPDDTEVIYFTRHGGWFYVEVESHKNSNDTEEFFCEAVEVCPYCSSENLFPNWDVEKRGYIAKCHECGESIMLCDECLHAEDNPNHNCDWHEEQHKGENWGICCRGITKHRI